MFLVIAQSELGRRLGSDDNFIKFSLLFLGSEEAGRGKGDTEEMLNDKYICSELYLLQVPFMSSS